MEAYLLALLFLASLCSLTQAQSMNPLADSYTRGGAFTYGLPGETVLGFEQAYTVKSEESLMEIARFFGLGLAELVDANPGIDPWIPPQGTKLRIPTAWILPQAQNAGVVINIAEMRLYYFFEAGGLKMVKTFPIGIGREGFSTPLGIYQITGKVRNPAWYPPASAREEDPALDRIIPPGPENPLGGYWLQLSAPGYGIHGTNEPWGVGSKVSRGCIRLYPEDIPWLFETVKVGTRVEIVNQSIKIGYRDNRLYVQVRKNGQEPGQLLNEANALLERIMPSRTLDRPALERAIIEGNGLTTFIPG